MGLSARQLLESVYFFLIHRLDGKQIILPYPAAAEIACDYDYHRESYGHFVYKKAVLLLIGAQEKSWAISFGVRSEEFLAEPYDCDIIAVPLPASISKESERAMGEIICQEIERSEYFCHSLIYAKADGQLFVNLENSFGQKVLEQLRPRLKGFIVQKAEKEHGLFFLDGRPVIASPVKYRHETIGFLGELFLTLFQKKS